MPRRLLHGAAASCGSTIGPSVQSDIIDWDELQTGERKEGAYFSSFTLLQKTSAGLMAMLTGFALGAAGFVPNEVQSAETRFWMRAPDRPGPVRVLRVRHRRLLPLSPDGSRAQGDPRGARRPEPGDVRVIARRRDPSTTVRRSRRPVEAVRVLGRWAAVAAVSLTACGGAPPDPADFAAERVERGESEPCANRDPLRRALFGDLHVHTALSSDAWNYDLEVRPHGAYDYAFGGTVELPLRGGGSHPVRLDRPLDFMAVTDHAEFMGEQRICSDPAAPGYDSETCAGIRESTTPVDNPLAFKIMNPWVSRDADVCGDDGARCQRALLEAWQEVIAAAEAWNDTSAACAHTTFIAYEYSSHLLGANHHRKRDLRRQLRSVPAVSFVDVQREWELWELLDAGCKQSGTGCDVLAIPHNSNISNGRMFKVDYPGADSTGEQVARARLQARWSRSSR